MTNLCDRCEHTDPENYLELGNEIPVRLCDGCLFEDFDGNLGHVLVWIRDGAKLEPLNQYDTRPETFREEEDTLA